MPIQQVSVFLDNRPGSLSEVITYLDRFKIKIFALSIADAGEFGLIRIITEDAGRATKILEDADFNLAKSKKNIEVTVILTTEKDKVSRIAKILGDNDLNIEYAYSSAVRIDGKFALVLRVDDLDKAERILEENDVAILSLDEIKKVF
ncbi:MAG: amino acid-binding protein [Candidatus Bathyarchaeota archaeon]